MHLKRQIEDEATPLVNARWFSPDFATWALHQLFDDGQSKADPVIVDCSRALQLAKFRKKSRNVFGWDAYPGIYDLHHQVLFYQIVGHIQGDQPVLGKFERVLDQVDQDLLEAPLIANQ